MNYEGSVSSFAGSTGFPGKRGSTFSQQGLNASDGFGRPPILGQGQFNQPSLNPGTSQFNVPQMPFGQPAFGQSTFGQQPSSGLSAFAQPAFGQSAFGQPAFGQPPVFSGQRPNYSESSAFSGSTPAFGQTTFANPISSSTGVASAFPNHSAFEMNETAKQSGAHRSAKADEKSLQRPISLKSKIKSQSNSGKDFEERKEKNSKDRKQDLKNKKALNSQKSIIQPPVFQPCKFEDRLRPQPNSAAILRPLPKPLTTLVIQNDPWDIANQSKMQEIEQEYLMNKISLQTAYEILSKMRKQERDEMEQRGLVDSTKSRKDLNDAIRFVGSCNEMCPVFERVRRAHENNVLSFEKNGQNQVSKDLAIKAFSRPAAGQPPPLPSDVRPPQVLVQTMQYLVRNVLPMLPQAHPFIWDRTRSIRQDFTYQNYQGPEAIYCFEVIARIHCYCLHFMARAVSEDDVEWSQQQEFEQFNKCLQSLVEFYQSKDVVSPVQAEMCSYQLMSQFFDDELASSIDRLAPEIVGNKLVNLALELRSLARTSVALFFKRIRQPDIPVTIRAIAEVHYNRLRLNAIRDLLTSLHRKTNMYPFSRFVELLGFEQAGEARSFCDFYDLLISCDEDNVEEVDLKSWEESNVQDKQQMPQAFDVSLDIPLSQLNVLSPVSSSAANAEGVVEKPTYPESTLILKSQSKDPLESLEVPASVKSTAAVANRTTTSAPPQPKKSAEQYNFSKAQNQNLFIQNNEIKQLEKLRPESEETANAQLLEHQKAKEIEEKQKKIQEQLLRQQKLEQERIQEQERAKAAALELQKRQKEQELRERLEQRSYFVDKLSQNMFESLIASTAANDCMNIIRSVDYCNKRILKNACRNILFSAKFALKNQNERTLRAKEVLQFREKRGRVVSNRRAKYTPTNSIYSITEVTERSDRNHVPDSEVSNSIDFYEAEALDFEPLKSIMRKASSCGLRKIWVSADLNTSPGKWLYSVMKVGQYVTISPEEFIKIEKCVEFPEANVIIIEKGDNLPSSSSLIYCVVEKSRQKLTEAIRNLLLQFVEIVLLRLNAHKSLVVKRRRISSPTKTLRHESQISPIKPRKSLPSAEIRLKIAIENAQKLLQD